MNKQLVDAYWIIVNTKEPVTVIFTEENNKKGNPTTSVFEIPKIEDRPRCLTRFDSDIDVCEWKPSLTNHNVDQRSITCHDLAAAFNQFRMK